MAAPPPPWLIEESALELGRQIAKSDVGVAYAATLNGTTPVCAKVSELGIGAFRACPDCFPPP